MIARLSFGKPGTVDLAAAYSRTGTEMRFLLFRPALI